LDAISERFVLKDPERCGGRNTSQLVQSFVRVAIASCGAGVSRWCAISAVIAL
jgi:hypothetical protein